MGKEGSIHLILICLFVGNCIINRRVLLRLIGVIRVLEGRGLVGLKRFLRRLNLRGIRLISFLSVFRKNQGKNQRKRCYTTVPLKSSPQKKVFHCKKGQKSQQKGSNTQNPSMHSNQ